MDGVKMNTNNDSSSSAAAVRLTLQVDNTSALPIFLQGRVSFVEKKMGLLQEKKKENGKTIQWSAMMLRFSTNYISLSSFI